MKRFMGGCALVLGTLGMAWGVTCPTSETGTTPYDLTTAGSSATVNGAIFQQIQPRSTGTGIIDPFVRLNPGGSDNCEQAYNTSQRNLPANDGDANSALNYTHDLTLATLNTTTTNIDGIDYYQFMLDINQNKSDPSQFLSLDQIKIYQSNTTEGVCTGDPCEALTSTGNNSLGTLVYNMDAGPGGDVFVKLNYLLNTGSGSGDMFLYVKKSLFDQNLTNVYFWSRFGDEWNANDGFEEWATAVGTVPVPEPGALLLFGTALASVGYWQRRRVVKA